MPPNAPKAAPKPEKINPPMKMTDVDKAFMVGMLPFLPVLAPTFVAGAMLIAYIRAAFGTVLRR